MEDGIPKGGVDMRTVRVKWEGPLSLDEVKDLDDEDEDCGLYQIYGHPRRLWRRFLALHRNDNLDFQAAVY